jgi:hypothetical protein
MILGDKPLISEMVLSQDPIQFGILEFNFDSKLESSTTLASN